MTAAHREITTATRIVYATLRHGGAPPGRARAQLGLEERHAARLERLFQKQSGRGGPDAMRPRFARHDEHVDAILALGGFPTLAEARR